MWDGAQIFISDGKKDRSIFLNTKREFGHCDMDINPLGILLNPHTKSLLVGPQTSMISNETEPSYQKKKQSWTALVSHSMDMLELFVPSWLQLKKNILDRKRWQATTTTTTTKRTNLKHQLPDKQTNKQIKKKRKKKKKKKKEDNPYMVTESHNKTSEVVNNDNETRMDAVPGLLYSFTLFLDSKTQYTTNAALYTHTHTHTHTHTIQYICLNGDTQ